MICSNCESTGFTCGGCGVNLEPEDAYTAAEVKVLTETASKVAYALGRKDALTEIADEMAVESDYLSYVTFQTDRDTALLLMAAKTSSQPSQAASDATSGVPGHPEVSEAVRSPQECPGCGQDGTGLENHDRDCPQNPYAASPQEPCGHPTCPCAEGNTP